jgi:hypothetical protein
VPSFGFARQAYTRMLAAGLLVVCPDLARAHPPTAATDPCALVTAAQVSVAIARSAHAIPLNGPAQTTPSGTIFGSCSYEATGMSVVVSFEQHSTLTDAKTIFAETVTGTKQHYGASYTPAPDPDQGGEVDWRQTGDVYCAGMRKNRIVTIAVRRTGASRLPAVPRVQLRALMAAALAT